MASTEIKNISGVELTIPDLGIWLDIDSIYDLSSDSTEEVGSSEDLLALITSGDIVYLDEDSGLPLTLDESLAISEQGHTHNLADLEEKDFSSLTGVPASFTPEVHDHNDLYYVKQETDDRIQAVVDAAPAALDTLSEIADSLNNDPDFAATITTSLAGKSDTAHLHDDRYYTKGEEDTIHSSFALNTHDHLTVHYTKTEVDTALALKADNGHNHDTVYYIKSEVDTIVGTKSDTTHNHNLNDLTEKDYGSLANPPADDNYADASYLNVPNTSAILAVYQSGAYRNTTLADIAAAINVSSADLIWTEESGNFSIQPERRYFASGTNHQVATLPATAAVGDMFAIIGGGNTWEIKTNASATEQRLIYDGSNSAYSVGDSIKLTESASDHSVIQVVCVKADSDFLVMYDKQLNYSSSASSHLYLHYSFDTGTITGSTVVDQAPPGGLTNGEADQVIWSANSKVGDQSVEFNEGNGITVSNMEVGTGADNFTVACWIRPKGKDLDAGQWATWIHQPDVFEISTLTDRVTMQVPPEDYITQNDPIPQDTWTHLALTYDGTYVRMWVDGVEQDDKVVKTSPIGTTTEPAYLGLWWSGGDKCDGNMDQLKIFTKALNEAEIAQLVLEGA